MNLWLIYSNFKLLQFLYHNPKIHGNNKKKKWKLHEFEPNLIKFQSTSISLSRLWNPWKGYKKLKVEWICGQFTQIWNHFNFFTTTTKSMGMIKKSWMLHEFGDNLHQLLYRVYEIRRNDQKSWKLYEFMANLLKF